MLKIGPFILVLAVCMSIIGCQENEVAPAPMADLRIYVNAVGRTDARALTDAEEEYYKDALASCEEMHRLRFVVVRPDETVEHNRLLNLYNPAERYGYESFEVVGGETKTVYLFVNESTNPDYPHGPFKEVKADNTTTYTKFDLNDIKVGQRFPTEDINALVIKLADGDAEWPSLSPLPMNGIGEVDVPKTGFVQKTMYVTRAAVKFTYRFTNNSSQDYTLQGLTIDQVTDKEYYMPNNPTPALKDVTKEDPITDLTIHPEAKYATYSKEYSFSIPSGCTKKVLPSIYQLEGKYNATMADATQRYKTSITLDGGVGTLEAFLKGLPNLVRNTHAVVDITINESNITWEVDVIPYSSVELNPSFGL